MRGYVKLRFVALVALAPVLACKVDPLTAVYNNCNTIDFKIRGESGSERTVLFGGDLGLSYSPRCMTITAGESVEFKGAFATHPIAAGTSPSTPSEGSTSNPIATPEAGTTDMTYTFPTAGQYPYYCQHHFDAGMAGVIRVTAP